VNRLIRLQSVITVGHLIPCGKLYRPKVFPNTITAVNPSGVPIESLDMAIRTVHCKTTILSTSSTPESAINAAGWASDTSATTCSEEHFIGRVQSISWVMRDARYTYEELN